MQIRVGKKFLVTQDFKALKVTQWQVGETVRVYNMSYDTDTETLEVLLRSEGYGSYPMVLTIIELTLLKED